MGEMLHELSFQKTKWGVREGGWHSRERDLHMSKDQFNPSLSFGFPENNGPKDGWGGGLKVWSGI